MKSKSYINSLLVDFDHNNLEILSLIMNYDCNCNTPHESEGQ